MDKKYLMEILNDAESKNKLLNKNKSHNNDNARIIDEDNFLLDEYGEIMNELERLKNANNIRNNQKYNINLNSVNIEENYI